MRRPIFVWMEPRLSFFHLGALMGMAGVDLADVADLMNLRDTPVPRRRGEIDERAAARCIAPKLAGRRVVLVGRRVWYAFAPGMLPLEVRRRVELESGAVPSELLALPSPAGSWWRDELNAWGGRIALRRFLRLGTPKARRAVSSSLAAASTARRFDLELSPICRMELEQRQQHDQRARAILLVADGLGLAGAGRAVGVNRRTVWKWKRAYLAGGLDALHPRRGRRPKRSAA